jgi:thioester reductase-like protein
MGAVLLTGFPGFLASSLLPRVLARRPGDVAICLVQERHLTTARQRLASLAPSSPELGDRVSLVVGDITAPDLGVHPGQSAVLAEVDQVWHLAAVYDVTVPEEFARRVNVAGTDHVVQFCRRRDPVPRLQYVSTCAVSGDYRGQFAEDDLEVGQGFSNFYVSTKYEAEQVVRAAMADGLPATIYRPGMVVGDSTTGQTQKYDGPYFVARYMLRAPAVTVLPRVDPHARQPLVPRDFVIDAMDALSALDHSVGRTYHVMDPDPPTSQDVAEMFADLLGRRLLWLPIDPHLLRVLLGSVPGLERLTGLPAEALDYFNFPTTYDTTHLTTDLAGTGLACPPFASYAARLLDFMQAHPEIDSHPMI